MRQSQSGRLTDILRPGLFAPRQCRQGNRRLDEGDIGAMPVHPQLNGQLGDHRQQCVADTDLRQQAPCPQDRLSQFLLTAPVSGGESGPILVVGHPALDDFHPLRRFVFTGHSDGQPESVEQLRPDVAFFRVHGTHQNKAGRMGIRYAFPFDRIDPHGRRIQQHVHHMVVQQIDFIHI